MPQTKSLVSVCDGNLSEIYFLTYFRGGITPHSQLSGHLCQVNSSPGGLLADCICVFGCLYLDALDGNRESGFHFRQRSVVN